MFDTWYSSVVRYGYHSCGSVELAEEFAQEAFAALYRNLRDNVVIENPRAWILATVHNQTAKHWRSRRRHPEDPLPNTDLQTREADETNGTGAEEAAKLSDYLGLLTAREEEVILLRAKGLKYGEIASHLGISTNSVGTLLMRAVRKIRKTRETSALEPQQVVRS